MVNQYWFALPSPGTGATQVDHCFTARKSTGKIPFFQRNYISCSKFNHFLNFIFCSYQCYRVMVPFCQLFYNVLSGHVLCSYYQNSHFNTSLLV